MKKLLIIPVLLAGIFFGLLGLAGVTPSYLFSAPGVATGIGSKLLCSARYVSGFSQEQAFDDLVQYSSILNQLSIDVDEGEKTVTTSLVGLSTQTANYLPGIGCAVEYSGFEQRADLNIRDMSAKSGLAWPAGNDIGDQDAELTDFLRERVRRDNTAGLNTRALLVVHQGAIVAEAYAQGADADTPLLGWSMAKSLNSIMLGNLEYQGRLDLNQSPGFVAWDSDQRSQIRVTHMLTMTDGLAFSEEYDPGDDATAMLFTVPSSASYVLEKEALRAPGSFFNYSSGTANLLSKLYQDTIGGTQEAYDEYLDTIHLPLGFQNAVFEMDASGTFVGSSYLYASARDWARIGQLMLNGGTINGERIVTQNWIDRATSPNDSLNQKAYGYQWWLNRGNNGLRWEDLPEDAYSAQGNRHQYLMVIPSLELVIVRLGWTAGPYPINGKFQQIIQAL